MSKLYFGKFGKDKSEQLKEKFYAAGPKGNSWYGGIEPGDYVFPVDQSQGKIIGLWRVREYGDKTNETNQDDSGVVFFEELNKYDEPIPRQQFIKHPYFQYDLNLLNKLFKQTNGCGFFPIELEESAKEQNPIDFDFNRRRNIYLVVEGTPLNMKENDIRITISNLQEGKLNNVEIMRHGEYVQYEPLLDLYEEKNKADERYTLHELLQFAETDDANNKKKYLNGVLAVLEEKGIFLATNPMQLYDNLLVGRKKTKKSKSKLQSDDEGAIVPVIDENDIPFEELEDYQQYADLLDFNPNVILYGPPGTGKTYATKKIIEAYEMKKNREYVHFNSIEKEGRVTMITFHQSYSYEEFIEGIRPQIDDSENSEIRYKIEDGILKKMVQSASTQLLKAENQLAGTEFIKDTSRIWKVSLGNRHGDAEIYKQCKKHNKISVGWLYNIDLSDQSYEEIFQLLQDERKDGPTPYQDASSINAITNEMSVGDIVLIYDGPTTIRDIGVINSDYTYAPDEAYPHTRPVVWLKEFKEPHNIYEYNGRKRLTLKTIYELTRINMTDIQKWIHGQEITRKSERLAKAINPKPYYLIIDEINRGNISKIFGELITLIEKDKRNQLSVTLPYSDKPFTLPPNLFIIGTMNTADRSIAVLDTALRRRFTFIELEPNPTIFSKGYLNGSTHINDTIDLEKLLQRLNEQITNRIGRDHRSGHAYFMDLITLDDFYKAWYYKILPLLVEYFYNDIEAVKDIIGSVFFTEFGSTKFLSSKQKQEGLSEFEAAIVSIYKEKS